MCILATKLAQSSCRCVVSLMEDPESADDWKGGHFTFKGNGKGKDKKGEKTATSTDVELGENQSGQAADLQCNTRGTEK